MVNLENAWLKLAQNKFQAAGFQDKAAETIALCGS